MDLVGVSKFLSSRALYEERTELMKMKEQGGKGRITRFVSQGHECELRIYALSMQKYNAFFFRTSCFVFEAIAFICNDDVRTRDAHVEIYTNSVILAHAQSKLILWWLNA